MKTLIFLFILTLSLGLKAQHKYVLYYDNRDSSVVNFFSDPKVSRMLEENPRCGFSTVNFTVSEKGKVIAIHNLNNQDDLFFKTAKEAIERSSDSWIIKSGLKEQNFQITFFIISTRLDSLRKSDPKNSVFKVPLNSYIKYNDNPKELTILPTVTVLFKEKNRKPTFTDPIY
ncbi:hypothetical protein [Pedobacter cryoconitis]|uniref:Uncharacterized protein n=1 Tax=Pedobacter cryoconitis TaxID=188932 RepID=A0A7X0J1H6_9SPHI|nr:hypothetical protein [Pedobacter cryoconitis]MBB6498954.1 hypothetical protein [Pedobacter cryoconitis]